MIPTTTETPEEVKARGAFYTPIEVTEFIAGWAIRDASDIALEPSCGDGAFIAAAADRFAALGRHDLAGHLYGIELDDQEAVKSRALAPTAEIRTSSFFDVKSPDLPTISAVIGNPPYIRYHGFTGDDRKAGLARAAEQGVKLTQLASSWEHFVVHAASFLDEHNGRLALVLPAELLHTDYAEPVRDFLTTRFNSVVVVAFDSNIFDDAQVDAVLLLASNDDNAGMRLVRVHDAPALAGLDVAPDAGAVARQAARRWSVTIDADAERIYADLVASGRVERLGSLASVDIGVVTGNNAFFVMTEAEAQSRGFPAAFITPIVSRPGDIPGLIVKDAETKRLLDLRGKPEPTDEATLAYIAAGKEAGVSDGYKCRTRKPWFGVPLPKVKPDAFMPYMNSLVPRLIVNEPGAWSTNLVHGVAFFEGHRDVRAVSAAMLSAVTALSSEIEGRAYGGGVLKTETKEAERLLVPVLDDATEAALLAIFDDLDALVRRGDYATASAKVDAVLDIEHERFRVAWEVFRSRRIGRKSKS